MGCGGRGPKAPLSTERGVPLDRVVAVVNDGVVLESELETATGGEIRERLQTQKVTLPPEAILRSQVLERLVLEEIQAQRADHAAASRPPTRQVNAAMEDIARRNGVPFADLPARLASSGPCLRGTTVRSSSARSSGGRMLRGRDVMQAHLNLAARARPVRRAAQNEDRDRRQ